MTDIKIIHEGIEAHIDSAVVEAAAKLGIDAVTEIKEAIAASMPRAIVFSKPNCPYCVKAKHLLDQNGISFDELSAVEHRDALIDTVTKATGQAPKTVPQIFIDGTHIGGHDQLVIWLQERDNAVQQDQG